ncbi:MAG: phosphoribosylformylglycinamidine synthase subunit PurL [Microthrixaceae bacterium]|nr:phosphoribosylformylglycinamidine synthase subunit PurL [Microthrixaceae bacterium]MCO5311678.1 phosphoribosylformylglycinamidine synthase subunit PurL [Microthrixaceae bacterium]
MAAPVDVPVHQALGLTDSELDDIIETLGREPNHLELAMYSVMWSEHCSYKSSRVHLKRLPTEAEWVMVGPGENAGVVDVGDGIALAMRIESHNHPSAIEPYQGAATGVGGILRDIFTMGARPIALMDPLRFGSLDDARSRWIAEGVVSGVSGYGNSVGVPTIGGETVFDATYQGNPLVNVFCAGILPHERLVLAKASGHGNLAVLLGSSTGRDGIGGVSVLASAGFGDEEQEQAKRPSVQVGDPYEEKRLIEACLALLDAGYVVGIQDLGGAGLVCATSETAASGGVGMDVYVRAVPQREADMEPFEIMTSESQERMLAIVEPSNLEAVLGICRRWEINAAVVGTVNTEADGMLRIFDCADASSATPERMVGCVPAKSLDEDSPVYHRPMAEPEGHSKRRANSANGLAAPDDVAADLLEMLCDTSWVYSQYDHQLFLNTVETPGGDAAVLRLKHPSTGADTGKGLAFTTDGNHRWCAVDPRVGTAATVAESIMNLASVGARPLAVVNCLNFGNPEHPVVMWQLSEAVDGMTEACLAFGVPVIGGNVSLYNESRGSDIDPTPVVGTLGLIDELTVRPPSVALVEGGRILLLGETQRELSGSLWARNQGHVEGTLPEVDYDAIAKVAGLVRQLVADRMVVGTHDVSSGGVGLAVAEMAVRSGVGARLARISDHIDLFSESVGRTIVCVEADRAREVLDLCELHGVPVTQLGAAGGEVLSVKDLFEVPLSSAVSAWRDRLSDALGSGTVQG